MAAYSDPILEFIEGIPYDQRASGGATTQQLAEMLAKRMLEFKQKSKDFQAQAAEQNKTLFNPPIPQPPPQGLTPHPGAMPLESHGVMPNAEAQDPLAVAPQQQPGPPGGAH